MATQSLRSAGSKDLKDSWVIGRKFLHCKDLAADSRFMSLASSRNSVAFKEVSMYRGRTLKVLNTLAALSAMTMLAVCKIASASGTVANLVLSYPSGFASAGSAISIAGQAALSGANINLTTTAGAHEAGAVWHRTVQNVQSFTTDFTFQLDPSTTECGSSFKIVTRAPIRLAVAVAITVLLLSPMRMVRDSEITPVRMPP